MEDVYERIKYERRYITADGERLVVFAGPINGDDSEVVWDLIRRGFIKRRKIGERKVLVLGEWSPVEELFSGEKVGEKQELLSRFPPSIREIVKECLRCLLETRKRGIIAPSVKVRFLENLLQYPPEAIEEGLSKYVERGFYREGKPEAYALGIVRSIAKEMKERDPAEIPDHSESKMSKIQARLPDEKEVVDKAVLGRLSELGYDDLDDVPSAVLAEVLEEVKA